VFIVEPLIVTLSTVKVPSTLVVSKSVVPSTSKLPLKSTLPLADIVVKAPVFAEEEPIVAPSIDPPLMSTLIEFNWSMLAKPSIYKFFHRYVSDPRSLAPLVLGNILLCTLPVKTIVSACALPNVTLWLNVAGKFTVKDPLVILPVVLISISFRSIAVETVSVSPVVTIVPVTSGIVIVLSAVGFVIASVVSLVSSVLPSKTKSPVTVKEQSLFK